MTPSIGEEVTTTAVVFVSSVKVGTVSLLLSGGEVMIKGKGVDPGMHSEFSVICFVAIICNSAEASRVVVVVFVLVVALAVPG